MRPLRIRFLILMLLLVLGCRKDPCFNIAELDKQTAATKEWLVDDTIGNQIISDTNGIHQTLRIDSKNLFTVESSAEDDCGNTYSSFDFSISFITSFSRNSFMINIYGGADLENSFFIKLMVSNPQMPGQYKETTYNFVSHECKEKNASIEFLDKIIVNNKEYQGVLSFTFNETSSSKEVKTVYYSKGYGIIKFVFANGNFFEV